MVFTPRQICRTKVKTVVVFTSRRLPRTQARSSGFQSVCDFGSTLGIMGKAKRKTRL